MTVALYGKGEAAKAVDQLQQALAIDQEFTAAPQAAALLEKIRAELQAAPARCGRIRSRRRVGGRGSRGRTGGRSAG
jgi:hypothetical protein